MVLGSVAVIQLLLAFVGCIRSGLCVSQHSLAACFVLAAVACLTSANRNEAAWYLDIHRMEDEQVLNGCPDEESDCDDEVPEASSA